MTYCLSHLPVIQKRLLMIFIAHSAGFRRTERFYGVWLCLYVSVIVSTTIWALKASCLRLWKVVVVSSFTCIILLMSQDSECAAALLPAGTALFCYSQLISRSLPALPPYPHQTTWPP